MGERSSLVQTSEMLPRWFWFPHGFRFHGLAGHGWLRFLALLPLKRELGGVSVAPRTNKYPWNGGVLPFRRAVSPSLILLVVVPE